MSKKQRDKAEEKPEDPVLDPLLEVPSGTAVSVPLPFSETTPPAAEVGAESSAAGKKLVAVAESADVDALRAKIVELERKLAAATEPEPLPDACRWKVTFRHGDLKSAARHLRVLEVTARSEKEAAEEYVQKAAGLIRELPFAGKEEILSRFLASRQTATFDAVKV